MFEAGVSGCFTEDQMKEVIAQRNAPSTATTAVNDYEVHLLYLTN